METETDALWLKKLRRKLYAIGADVLVYDDNFKYSVCSLDKVES